MSKINRIFSKLTADKTKGILAFVLYVLFIVSLLEIGLPLAVNIIIGVVMSIIILVFYCYFESWLFETICNTTLKDVGKEIVKIIKEIGMFFIFLYISNFFLSIFIVGQPENQTSVVNQFYQSPIINSIMIIIIGPVLEEVVFRYLPYQFICNKKIYVIVSALVFASMHVVDDSNALYYVWAYMGDALYFGYRYYKTKDLRVTISIHIFNNAFAMFPLIMGLL